MTQPTYFDPTTGRVMTLAPGQKMPQFSGGGYAPVAGWQPTSFSRVPEYGTTVAPQTNDTAGYQAMRTQVAQGSNFSPNMTRLQSLVDNPSTIAQDPSYQFRFDEGNRAINRSAAAKGMLGSGNVLAELAKYGQGMASQEYGNQFSRLSDLVGQQQAFGLRSGYFGEPARTTQGWEGGAMVTRRNETPSYW